MDVWRTSKAIRLSLQKTLPRSPSFRSTWRLMQQDGKVTRRYLWAERYVQNLLTCTRASKKFAAKEPRQQFGRLLEMLSCLPSCRSMRRKNCLRLCACEEIAKTSFLEKTSSMNVCIEKWTMSPFAKYPKHGALTGGPKIDYLQIPPCGPHNQYIWSLSLMQESSGRLFWHVRYVWRPSAYQGLFKSTMTRNRRSYAANVFEPTSLSLIDQR